jgi:tetratricopeptide (TPR) repeat protein
VQSLSARKVLLILLALAVSIMAPIIVAANRNIGLAQASTSAKEYSKAAQQYELAARELPWRTDLWERAGLVAYAGGDQGNALRLLQVAAAKSALSARGWDVLGSVHWAKADRAAAISTWQMGSKANPKDASLLDHLAHAYHQQSDFAAEQAALEGRLSLGDDALTRFRLGLLLMLSDPADAPGQITAAAAMNSEFASASSTALGALQAASLNPAPSGKLVLLGRGLGLLNEWGLAAQAFDRAVRADPKNAEAWAWRGEAAQHNGADGRGDLDKALTLDAHQMLVHVLRGLYWRRQGNNSEALAEYLVGAQLDPYNPALQSSLGEAYAASGDLVAALRAYQDATGLAPADPHYWTLLALFCADNGVQVLEVGLPAAQRAAQMAPKDPQVLDALGWSYAQAGYQREAERTLLQAIQAGPEVTLAHIHLAETYLQMGENSLALQQLNLARRLDPSGPAGLAAAQLLARYFP